MPVIANQKVVSIRNSRYKKPEQSSSYSKSESGVNPQHKNLPHRPKHIQNTKSGHSDLALT